MLVVMYVCVIQQNTGMMRTKYDKYDGKNGLFTVNSDIVSIVDEQFRPKMAAVLNAAWSFRSWKNTRSVLQKVQKLSSQYGIDLNFPWDQTRTMNFMLAAAMDGLQPATIRTYVSRCRTAQKSLGFRAELDCQWINPVLKGLEATEKGPEKFKRRPVTTSLMLTIKKKLAASRYNIEKRRLIWMVCTALFSGSLRAGELLPVTRNKYVESSTMMRSDVMLSEPVIDGERVRVVLLRIRSPKEMRANTETVVELMGFGNFYDPVTAMEKYLKLRTQLSEDDQPLALLQGWGYTQAMFNADIRTLLGDTYDYAKEGVLSHSFRAGVTTMLARLGATDDEIKLQGRWSSSSFEKYIKYGRAQRLAVQKRLHKSLAEAVTEDTVGN